MGNSDECSDHKIIDKPNSCYGFDHDGKFCDVCYLMKQKYPHIKGTEDIASATLNAAATFFFFFFFFFLLFTFLEKSLCPPTFRRRATPLLLYKGESLT